MADEGKTITALMFACVASMDGLNVLLIDADLRRPSLAGIMGREGCDMERILGSSHNWQDLTEKDQDTGLTMVLPNCSIQQPQRFLGSAGIGQLISHAQRHFDLIVVDTPPVLMVSDALTLLAYGDVTVLLARSGSASHSGVAEAVQKLSRANSPPVVTVLSMSRERQSRGMYHGYGESAYGHS
jgi:receptor protein-tyrosine kinase